MTVQLLPFGSQIATWGAAWSGDVAERTAMLCEDASFLAIPMWDRSAADLNDEVLITPEGVTRVPDRFALYWLAVHTMQTGVLTTGGEPNQSVDG